MIQNNRYCKAKQAAMIADATRKRQRCNQRDPPRYVSSYTDVYKRQVYDDKVVGEEIRLDNGTSDIDTLDAFEYSFERYIPRLIRRD